MSIEKQPIDDRLDALSPISFPEDWTLSTSWQRAQSEHDRGSWVNDAERMVWLEGSDNPHRVVFTLHGNVLRTSCDCSGYTFRDWCAHVASCWWDWINGQLNVSHMQTGKEYEQPPDWLQVQSDGQTISGEGLTSAELDSYLSCELGNCGVREYARKTDRAPGTIGNLLRSARDKEGRQ